MGGVIDVRVWTSEDDEGLSADIQHGSYVMVHGKCAVFNGQTQINGHCIRKVGDYNEYTHHMVHAAYCYLTGAKKAEEGGAAPTTGGNFNNNFAGSNQNAAASTMPTTGAGMDNNADMNSWSECTKAVYQLVERLQSQSENGVHVPEIMRHLSQFSESQIRESIVSLGNDGMVYDTVDETWIKTTSGDD